VPSATKNLFGKKGFWTSKKLCGRAGRGLTETPLQGVLGEKNKIHRYLHKKALLFQRALFA